MKSRKIIELTQVFVVLLLSLVASFVFSLKIDFTADIDIMSIVRLVLLCYATYILNFKVYFFLLGELEQAEKEYVGQSEDEKAIQGIDDIFHSKIVSNKKRLVTYSILTVILFLSFLCEEAIIKLI